MRMMIFTAVALAVAAPAAARDATGFQAIAAGDLSAAEQRLIAERRIFPDRPELMLNLAAVYARTGRLSEARALYADVLGSPSVALDLADGRSVLSHDIATAALGRISGERVATR